MFVWLCSSNVASWVTPGSFSSSWITRYPSIFRPLTAANFKCCASEWLNMAGLELRMPSQRLSDVGISMLHSFSRAILLAGHSKSFWNKKHSGNENISKFWLGILPQSKHIWTHIYISTDRVTFFIHPQKYRFRSTILPPSSPPFRQDCDSSTSAISGNLWQVSSCASLGLTEVLRWVRWWVWWLWCFLFFP